MDMAAQEKKKALQEKLGAKPSPSSKPSGLKNMECGETIKIHLKKIAPGQDWTDVHLRTKALMLGNIMTHPDTRMIWELSKPVVAR